MLNWAKLTLFVIGCSVELIVWFGLSLKRIVAVIKWMYEILCLTSWHTIMRYVNLLTNINIGGGMEKENYSEGNTGKDNDNSNILIVFNITFLSALHLYMWLL